MNSRNKLIYLIRSIIGEDEPSGFYTYVDTINGTFKVPNYLFKDAPAEYPEIRISPFISDIEQIRPQRYIGPFEYHKVKFFKAIFQIDIYATTIPMVNNIYDTVSRRIDLFTNRDTITYGYNKSFKKIDEDIYFSPIYDSRSFNIFRIVIGRYIIHRVDDIESLKDDTYTINEDGLYVKTTLPIKKIKLLHLVNGLLFNNHKSSFQEHIINIEVLNKKMLSELEDGRVERISFDMNILYHIDQKRNMGPILTDVSISCDENGRRKKRYKKNQ